MSSIDDHRFLEVGSVEFHVYWEDSPDSRASWVALDDLLIRRDFTFLNYLASQGISTFPIHAVGRPSTITLSQ